MNKEENMERPNRKRVRLPGFDYDTPGYYFITLCTTQKQKLLCDIVGTGLPDGPQVRFTQYGQIALAQLEQMCDFYDDLKVEKYVIMPNHIHMLIHLTASGLYREKNANPTNTVYRNLQTVLQPGIRTKYMASPILRSCDSRGTGLPGDLGVYR